jgi:hypothetical protein
MSVTCALFVAGLLIPGSAADTVDPTGLYAGDTLTVTWGRDDTVSQPDPTSCTFRLIRPAPVDWLRVGETVTVLATAPGLHVTVFIGSITSLAMSWDDTTGQPVVDVIADDVLADLGNRRVASTPWPAESLQARVDHVMAASRQDVAYTVGAGIAAKPLAKQDVDVRMATEVLQQVAASVDGVLWSTVTLTGQAPALLVEDTGARLPLRRLAKPASLIVIVFDADEVADVALTLDGCVFDRDSVGFTQDVDDIVTGVSVTYYTPDPTDSTAPDLDKTVDVVDVASESPLGGWGVRRIDLDTLLTNQIDATDVGNRILGRLRPSGQWRAPTLEFDQAHTPAITDAQLVQLLDSRTRIGLPLIVPLPAWAPNAEPLVGYLEGAVANYAGSWDLALTVSSAQGYGAADVMWNDMPDLADWCWNNWDPAITWDDLNGVGPPIGVS